MWYTGLVAAQHVGAYLQSGIETVSFALGGGFFTIEPTDDKPSTDLGHTLKFLDLGVQGFRA